MITVLHQDDIVDEYFGCPYCKTPGKSDDYRGCCGESSAHFCKIYVDKNDEFYLEDEVEIKKDKEN